MRNGIARLCLSAALLATTCLSITVQAAANDPSIARSNAYTQKVLDVVFKHAPEWASAQGLSQFDALVANPTLADR
jgi:methylase of polypeptide subunit release factors